MPYRKGPVFLLLSFGRPLIKGLNMNSSRRHFIRRAITLAVGSAAVPLLSSCASYSGGASAGNAAKPAAKASTAGKEHIIEIQSFQFSTKTLAVTPGDIVTWINRDSAPHTATATDSSWDTGLIAQGERKSVTMASGMAADYFCRFHPIMKAKVSVT